ncbi:Arsb [Symbiodinium sp. CCMP2592]|nr:Arsb [Symbiodinium sp. CCMP2592]
MEKGQGLAAFLPPPRPAKPRHEVRAPHELSAFECRESYGEPCRGSTSSAAPRSPSPTAALPTKSPARRTVEALDVGAKLVHSPVSAPFAGPMSQHWGASPCLAAKNVSRTSDVSLAAPVLHDGTETATSVLLATPAAMLQDSPGANLLAQAANDELEHLRAEEQSLRRLWQQLQAPPQGEDPTGQSVRQSEAFQREPAADELQRAEQELRRLTRQAECQELRQRREAEEQLSSKARADLEDARASCRATEARVAAETRSLQEELKEARQAAAGWLPPDFWTTSEPFDAAAAQARESQLRTELAELFEREAVARSLLERLRDLRSDAELRLPAMELERNQEKVREMSMDKGFIVPAIDPTEELQILRSTPSAQSSGSCEQPHEEHASEQSSAQQRLRLLQERAAKLHVIKEHLQRLSQQRRAREAKSDPCKDGASGSVENREPPRITRWQKVAHQLLSTGAFSLDRVKVNRLGPGSPRAVATIAIIWEIPKIGDPNIIP